MKNFRFFDSFRIEKLLTCMDAHRHGIQSRENSSKMADSFDFYVCGLPQPLKRSPGHPGALGMMAPIPGLTVADTCESHTLASRSGLGHRVFGVGASSPGVWQHHRGGGLGTP